MQKNTQLERNWLQSLEIGDDNSPKNMYGNILSRRVSDLNSFFELIFAYLRGCHMGVCHAYLAAGLPCFVVLNVSFDEAFKTYHYAIVSTR